LLAGEPDVRDMVAAHMLGIRDDTKLPDEPFISGRSWVSRLIHWPVRLAPPRLGVSVLKFFRARLFVCERGIVYLFFAPQMDQSRFIAKHVVNLPKSGIRDFFDIVAKMKHAIS